MNGADDDSGALLSAPLEALLMRWPAERWSAHPSVIAVSGGADSLALLRLMVIAAGRIEPTPRLIVAHFDHGRRGAESDGDREFVEQTAASLGLESTVERAAPSSWRSARDGFEQRARELRYRFLTDVAQRSGARHVVTAHTADDVAETVLFRLIRGTGIDGLAAIAPFRPLAPDITLVRPLIDVRRDALRRWLVAIDQPWREDSSNRSLDPTRNRIRLELLPLLTDILGRDPTEAIAGLARRAEEGAARLNRLDETILESWQVATSERGCELDRGRLRQASEAERVGGLRALWRRMGWPQRDLTERDWRALGALAGSSERGRLNLPGGISAAAEGERLVLTAPAIGGAGSRESASSDDSADA
ncbi:MAG TPA: tRNA lysidine(34) synthetase TilS [Pirellulaceae bacterium]|nr:tRNA lysidine(34) synthetase TilS [Pirellulaceae bacterium]